VLTKFSADLKNEYTAPERVCLTKANSERILCAVASRRWYCSLKRGFDVVFVLLAGPVVLIVIAIAALAILCSMGGPVFYVQERVGYEGRVFWIWKLRTMKPTPEKIGVATAINDCRVTPLGWFLRSTHIDELPQFWNILRGDMTLIGPRPEQVPLVEVYRNSLPYYDLRHLVRPGLSGWAQVRHGYAETVYDTRHKLEYDLFYLLNHGPMLDFWILALTFSVLCDPKMVR
jgi:lipopolysaccharide/colanic/teichoic acid biosynthesis glycosyltransferase